MSRTGQPPEEDLGFILNMKALAFVKAQVAKPGSALRVLFAGIDPLVRARASPSPWSRVFPLGQHPTLVC